MSEQAPVPIPDDVYRDFLDVATRLFAVYMEHGATERAERWARAAHRLAWPFGPPEEGHSGVSLS